MTAPSTISAVGYFQALRGNVAAGEAILRMQNATDGTLSLGGQTWTLSANPTTKKFHGIAPGSVVDVTMTTPSLLTGKVDGTPFRLSRNVLRPIPAAEMALSDSGPTGAMKAVMKATPDYQAEVGDNSTFWYAFGPVLYRGRLDGGARVMGIASDPGPSECLPFARRTLVGDSGQKTQGLLAKLGLIRSYVLVNASAVAMRPSQASKGLKALKTDVAIRTARHGLYDRLLASGSLQAIIAFGDVAHDIYDLWVSSNPAASAVPCVKIAHPAAVDRTGSGNDAALKGWVSAVTKLRSLVTADPAGTASGPNYGDYFTELDYERIPRWDLPSRAPVYFGDDSWGRAATPQHNNCCERPSPDDMVSLELTPAPGQGSFLRYTYKQGKLISATNKSGKTVIVDAFGIPA
jgi:hypothetical protein